MGSHEEGGALAESPRMTLLEETWPVVCDGLCMWGGGRYVAALTWGH